MVRSVTGSYTGSVTSHPSTGLFRKPVSPDTVSHISENAIVDREHLASISSHICKQLKTIIGLVTDFVGDVCDELESAGSLLRELQVGQIISFRLNPFKAFNQWQPQMALNFVTLLIRGDKKCHLPN
ncbi:unnamed protein product [Gongylonema pulchrum]|uniref:IMS_C domain-containing protein n=1 Tax=Gongylonema pulchrum TaxID=637853 RepID=A0A183D959_9BILA|nr:unnamed protein product [Gongylonema pulchrum]